jgi:membrane-associated phospholipid phosphatase
MPTRCDLDANKSHHSFPMTTIDDKRDPAAARSGPSDTPDFDDGTSPARHRSPKHWFSVRWSDPARRRVLIGWTVWSAGLIAYFVKEGVLQSLDWIFIFIAGALIVSSLGSGIRWKRLVIDWLPLFLVLTGYGLLRGYAAHTLWGPLVKPQVWFDSHVFGGVAPTVQLQRWLYRPGLHFWDYLTWCCYMSHFFVSFIIAGVLWKTNYPKFKRFVPLFVGLTFIGYVTYVLYPAMPPWLASETHNLPSVTRIIPLVLDHLHMHTGAAIFTGGNRFDNNVAAMPSLHGAYPMLICLFFWKGSSPRKRILLAAYPICMAFSLVYLGEHFVIDIFVGWIYAIATFYFGSKLLDRWEIRKSRKAGPDEPTAGLEASLPPSSTLSGSSNVRG